ncbi:LamG domain-containing protein [Kamptonema formosum]|uniref:LamG domain-containing protein n=1 Tax=Kamptonema formosum TaxID=331992 RepID=UPI00034D5AC8|nr:LamG domain-containing protein [Oscillatoria sp. PCC 10802]
MKALDGQFEVPATSEAGVEFSNTQSAEVSYTFTPTGTWTPNANNPSLSGCTAAGVTSYPPEIQKGILDVVPGGLGQYMKYPKNTPFALLAVNKATGAAVAEVGKQTTIPVKPGETLVFVVNDVPAAGYSDNTGSITVKWSGISAVSKVMQFDGVNDLVELGSRPEFKVPKDMTVEAWIYVSEQKKWAGIISKVFDTGSTESGYGILLDGSSGVYWGVKAQSSGIVYLSSGSNTVQLNKWHHVTGTYDGQNLVVWVDGVRKASQSVSPAGVGYDPENSLRIGAFKDDNESYYFKGNIAEVRLWNKVRSEQEIQADMCKRLTGKEANLVGYWPLNEVKQEGSTVGVVDMTNNSLGTVTEAKLVEDSSFPVR